MNLSLIWIYRSYQTIFSNSDIPKQTDIYKCAHMFLLSFNTIVLNSPYLPANLTDFNETENFDKKVTKISIKRWSEKGD